MDSLLDIHSEYRINSNPHLEKMAKTKMPACTNINMKFTLSVRALTVRNTGSQLIRPREAPSHLSLKSCKCPEIALSSKFSSFVHFIICNITEL